MVERFGGSWMACSVAAASMAIFAMCGQVRAADEKKAVPLTTANATAPADITIRADGTGTYPTIQAAIDAIPAYGHHPYVIHLKPGTYHEKIVIARIKPGLRIAGENAATTIITYGDGANMPGPDGKPMGTFATPTVSVLAPDFEASNVTFENSLGAHGQALAIEVAGDKDAFDHCRFIGFQDTIFADADGRNYFRDCYVEGAVDFIFGKSTAVFDHCEIHSVKSGYLTAASTMADREFGYVFLDCKLTAGADVKENSVFLGRPWRPAAATAFIRCEMGPQIRNGGWNDWGKVENHKTARYVEFGSTGPGWEKEKRVDWAIGVTEDEAKKFSAESVLGNWKPFSPPATQP